MADAMYGKSLDFKKTCRGCMGLVDEYEYIALHDNNKQNTIVEKFESCTALKVEKGDNLPHILCKKCVEQIEDAYAMRSQCRSSDAVLRNYLEMKVECNTLKQSDPCNIKDVIESSNLEGSIANNFNKSGNDVDQKYLNGMDQNTSNENTSLFLTQSSDYHIRKASKTGGRKLNACAKCNKSFKTLLALKSHKKTHNGEDEEYTSLEIKSADLSVKNIGVNIDSALSITPDPTGKSVRKLTCDVCNKTYLKASNLAAHMGLHTGVKPYHCTICGKKFTQGRAYACHMRIHENSSKAHICSKCDRQFENENELKAHEIEENSPCNSRIPNIIQEENNLQNTKTNTNSHTCPVCGRNYCNSGNLRAHMRLHTGDRPYSCNICGRKFAQSNAHSYHMKTHLGERSFTCDLCPKAFTTNGQLINHRRLHTGEKPYACTMCPRRFTQKVTYTIHMMSHTGNKPHLCSVCGKKYAQNSQLVEHMRTHNGEKYKCAQCSKSYSTAGNLAAHIRTHSGVKPHSCVVCGKSFYVANKLAKHMRSHTGERPFPCPVCPKRFTCSGVLTVHLRTHTGERPFTCSVCNKGFINNSQLTVHSKTHVDETISSTIVSLTSQPRTCVDPIISTVYNTSCENYNLNSKRLYTL